MSDAVSPALEASLFPGINERQVGLFPGLEELPRKPDRVENPDWAAQLAADRKATQPAPAPAKAPPPNAQRQQQQNGQPQTAKADQPTGQQPDQAKVDQPTGQQPDQAKGETTDQGNVAKGEPGDTSYLDAEHPETQHVAPVIKELGLTEQQVGRLTALREELQTQQTAAWSASTQAEFDERAIADARQVIKDYGDADLIAALNETGLGSHPAVVRFVVAVARGGAAARARF